MIVFDAPLIVYISASLLLYLYHKNQVKKCKSLVCGDKGEEIKRIQLVLLKAQLYSGKIDGIFGWELYKSITRLQKKYGLSCSGDIDKKTLILINKIDKGITAISKIKIYKKQKVLITFMKGVKFKTYLIDFYCDGLEDKNQKGDKRIPEGKYYICEKMESNLNSKWLRLSYPNVHNADRGLFQGLIDKNTHKQIKSAIKNKLMPPQDTALGGAVGIRSTNRIFLEYEVGSIIMTETDMNEIFDLVSLKETEVIILK